MVDSFLSYIQHEKRLSAHTLTAYSTDLAQFANFLLQTFDTSAPEKATFREIRAWIMELSDAKNTATSVNRKIASLRAFYGFLLRKKHITQNPMLKVKALKTPKKLPTFMEERAMDLLFDKVPFGSDFAGRRDKLIIDLLYGTGIRLAELIGLEMKDVDLFGSKITVLGKRNKQRIIPVSGLLIKEIQAYLPVRARFGDAPSSFFLTDKGQTLYPVFVQRLIKKYLGLVSSQDKRSPHVLRHTFATHLLNNGAELMAIKELLGHASLSATQIYTHNSIEQLKAIHEKSHPTGG